MTDRFRRAVPGLLFVLVFLAYWRASLDVPFQLDDEGLIETREDLRGPISIFGTIREALAVPFGRPLSMLTLHADFLLWGLDPRGYHVTALLLHLAAVWLVWRLVRRGAEALMPGGGVAPLAAWIAAAVFAFHPVQTESVAYLSARSTLLSTVLGLWGVLAADAALLLAREGRPWGWRATGAAALVYASVAAMPMGLVFPAVLVAWLVLVRRVSWRTAGAAVAAGGVLFAFMAGDLAYFFAGRHTFRPPGYATAYWMTQPECLLRAAGTVALPHALALDHDILPVGVGFAHGGEIPGPGISGGKIVLPFTRRDGEADPPEGIVHPGPGDPLPPQGLKARFSPAMFDAAFLGAGAAIKDPRVWGPLAILAAGGCAFAFWARRRRDDPSLVRAAAFGGALFLLGWIPSAAAPLEDLFFEHHLYLSMAGAAWIAGLCGARVRPGFSLAAGAAALFLLWGLLVGERLAAWSGKDLIWADSVRKSPGKPRPKFNLATMWHDVRRGPPERLRQMCVNASVAHVRFRDNGNLLAEIPNLLGGIHQWMGDLKLADFFYRDAVRRSPGTFAFRSNLAANARLLGRNLEAAALYAGILRERPGDPRYTLLLAESLAGAGRLAEAREILEGLVARDGNFHAAAVDLTAVMIQQGDLAGAVRLYRETASRHRSAPLLYNLAMAFLQENRPDEARQALGAALAIDPAYAPAHAALARMAGLAVSSPLE